MTLNKIFFKVFESLVQDACVRFGGQMLCRPMIAQNRVAIGGVVGVPILDSGHLY